VGPRPATAEEAAELDARVEGARRPLRQSLKPPPRPVIAGSRASLSASALAAGGGWTCADFVCVPGSKVNYAEVGDPDANEDTCAIAHPMAGEGSEEYWTWGVRLEAGFVSPGWLMTLEHTHDAGRWPTYNGGVWFELGTPGELWLLRNGGLTPRDTARSEFHQWDLLRGYDTDAGSGWMLLAYHVVWSSGQGLIEIRNGLDLDEVYLFDDQHPTLVWNEEYGTMTEGDFYLGQTVEYGVYRPAADFTTTFGGTPLHRCTSWEECAAKWTGSSEPDPGPEPEPPAGARSFNVSFTGVVTIEPVDEPDDRGDSYA
jgi:hypothetical protein